jgi:hypothetical protein
MAMDQVWKDHKDHKEVAAAADSPSKEVDESKLKSMFTLNDQYLVKLHTILATPLANNDIGDWKRYKGQIRSTPWATVSKNILSLLA